MSWYKECPYCGAHLDPGEVCDCRAVQKRQKKSRPGAANTRAAATLAQQPSRSFHPVSAFILANMEGGCQG